ncbi:MAG: cytidyltransferase-related domain protein [Clostridiales bacterium]|nr:cytidyltransferase-related domain protein [Clostridiales bacterium]
MMDERTAGGAALDALYAELAKSTGVAMKQLRAWTVRTKFDAEFTAMHGRRVSCAAVAALSEPLIRRIGEMPEEGLLSFAYESLSAGLYPFSGAPRSTKGKRSALKVFLTVLTRLLDAEREAAFDPLLDYLPITEEELALSPLKKQCLLFAEAMKKSYYRELLRIGKEIMPFDPAGHTFGVRHVAVHTARQAARAGLPADVALVAAASLSHDIGKFGCRGEDMPRIPYLHYYYTWKWLEEKNMPDIAHIAANHSTWDLEFENLPIESLILIYADFRVRAERGEDGHEKTIISPLTESRDRIFVKLADMTPEKRLRYETVYEKLDDFEQFLKSHGVNTDPFADELLPVEQKDAALLSQGDVIRALTNHAFDNNVHLMHTISVSDTFEALLEQARDEKNLNRIRTYLLLFEEYSTYMTRTHKLLTLRFLYELLMHHDGDVRRHAGRIMGAILANSGPRYRKELPRGAGALAIAPALHAVLSESTTLWDDYIELCLHPDYKISQKHASRISNSLKTIAGSLFLNCMPQERRGYWDKIYRRVLSSGGEALLALMDTLTHIPQEVMQKSEIERMLPILGAAAASEEARVRIRALRALGAVAGEDPVLLVRACEAVKLQPDAEFASVWLFNRLRKRAELDLLPEPEFSIAEIYLGNLKSSITWTMKLVHIERLCEYVHEFPQEAFHIAMHLSNLLSVSEHLPVRERAGEALVEISGILSVDQRNEILVDLLRELETGQNEISNYIPPYLGRLFCTVPDKEMDEGIDYLEGLLRAENTRAARAALSTLCAVLSGYASENSARRDAVAERVFGLLLTGVSHFDDGIRLTALEVICRGYFGNDASPISARRAYLARFGKKLLTLLGERRDGMLAFFNEAAMLNHLYRFITLCETEGGFTFEPLKPVAFFPGTFDPFSAGHKRIVEEICAHGFEVYLAVDEFSWSKRTLAKLLRRQIASMSAANLPDVYLFPDDIPVNLAVPEDLRTLSRIFSDRELYLVAGSDVILNASAYRQSGPGTAATYNHILFTRVETAHGEDQRKAEDVLRGRVVMLSLPAYYESASSTQIRDYIDKDMDIGMMVDPVVQDFIYARGLYLRMPQYKQEISALAERCCEVRETGDEYAGVYYGGEREILARITGRSVSVTDLYDTLGELRGAAETVRRLTSGRILWIGETSGGGEPLRALLCDLLARSLIREHTYALYRCEDAGEREVAEQLGFLPVAGQSALLVADMRAPLVLLEDALQRIKEPFASDEAVRAAVESTRPALRRSICALFPGTLLLCFDMEQINDGLIEKVRLLNGVSNVPPPEKTLGRAMCVPYGKILAETIVPNTVTKALHADKVFHADESGFDITESPGYSPLQNQIRTLKSFRRPVLLVDDLLHNGYRLEKLDPLFREQGVEIERIIVGILSGRGLDLMREQKRNVDCEYFVPNMLYWFTESLLYPFIGGDSVAGGIVERDYPPSINLILPYQYPKYLHGAQPRAVRQYSRVALRNALTILSVLEERYLKLQGTGLTLRRLGEALLRPRLPDKGAHMQYDLNSVASAYLRDDIRQMRRISNAEDV